MWLLNWIPDFVFHLILIIGVLGIVAGYVLDKVPFIETNAKTIQIIAIILTVIGVWFEGGISRDDYYKQQISSLEVKIAQSETQSAELNTKLVESLKQNEMLRKDRKYESKQVITKVVSKYDGNCVLSNAFVRVHDSASQDKLPEGSRGDDGNTSNVKPSEVLNTVIDNYEVCYNYRDKLIKWQEWYKNQRKISDEVQ